MKKKKPWYLVVVTRESPSNNYPAGHCVFATRSRSGAINFGRGYEYERAQPPYSKIIVLADEPIETIGDAP